MKDLHVAIGAIVGVTGGPASYAVELVGALAELESRGLKLTVLTDRADVFGGLAGVEVVEVGLRSAWGQPWWDNFAIPRELRRLGPDVYHGTKHALPLLGWGGAATRVVTIHDLAVFAEPETFSFAQRAQLHLHLRHSAWMADRVICVSQHAAGDVHTQLGVPTEDISVIPHGIGSIYRPIADEDRRSAVRQAYGVGEEEFLLAYVGTWQPRKRIDVAIEATAALVAQGLPVTLVIAGRRRPGFDPPWLASPPPFVRLVGEISSGEVVDLLGAADVMVSASSYEGFGLTFAEAMACGTPVVGVGVTSVPEVVGEGGLLVAEPSPDLVGEALGRLLSDEALRADKAKQARVRAGSLSWERAARASLEVYRAAHGA